MSRYPRLALYGSALHSDPELVRRAVETGIYEWVTTWRPEYTAHHRRYCKRVCLDFIPQRLASATQLSPDPRNLRHRLTRIARERGWVLPGVTWDGAPVVDWPRPGVAEAFMKETLAWQGVEEKRADGFNGLVYEVAAYQLFQGWLRPQQNAEFALDWADASEIYFSRLSYKDMPQVYGSDSFAPPIEYADGLLIEDFIHRFVNPHPATLIDWYEDAFGQWPHKRGIILARALCGTAEHTVCKTLWHGNHMDRASRERIILRDLVTTQLFDALWAYVIANPEEPTAPKTIIGMGAIPWPAVLVDEQDKLREWGQPVGEYTRTYGPPGPNAYQREFERCTITLDLDTLGGKVAWK